MASCKPGNEHWMKIPDIVCELQCAGGAQWHLGDPAFVSMLVAVTLGVKPLRRRRFALPDALQKESLGALRCSTEPLSASMLRAGILLPSVRRRLLPLLAQRAIPRK